MSDAALTIIAYDIPSDRRRRRIARIADDFGCRIQYSVFYAWLTRSQRDMLIACLESAIDPDEDAILIVPVCERCRHQVVELGQCAIEPLPLCWVF